MIHALSPGVGPLHRQSGSNQRSHEETPEDLSVRFYGRRWGKWGKGKETNLFRKI